MLSYAFQALQAQNYKDLATVKFHNTAELCAAILDKGISVQLKRGLGRDYLPKSESLSTLQGKLNISEYVLIPDIITVDIQIAPAISELAAGHPINDMFIFTFFISSFVPFEIILI